MWDASAVVAAGIPGAPDLRIGDAVGRYRLESVLGEGAVGVVIRASRLDDDTLVALKVLKPVLSADDVYRRRFVREAHVATEVRHSHLVPVLEVGEVDAHYYLAMAYVAGGSLADRLERERLLSLRDAVRLAAEIAAGLDALHARGIVHRDVKPSNVMLDERGRAALTDFGLAKGLAFTVLTRPGQMMGTLDYIAPELVKGEEASAASDIYALGGVVYECLTGAPPFSDRGLFEVAAAHLEEEPPDPRSKRAELPADVAAVLLVALAKEAAKRPRTATAFAHLLAAAARSAPR